MILKGRYLGSNFLSGKASHKKRILCKISFFKISSLSRTLTLPKNSFICFNESLLEMMNDAFYFTFTLTKGFLTFSGGIEMRHWTKMG